MAVPSHVTDRDKSNPAAGESGLWFSDAISRHAMVPLHGEDSDQEKGGTLRGRGGDRGGIRSGVHPYCI